MSDNGKKIGDFYKQVMRATNTRKGYMVSCVSYLDNCSASFILYNTDTLEEMPESKVEFAMENGVVLIPASDVADKFNRVLSECSS